MTAPPPRWPVPRTVNGTAPRPPSSMSAPSARSAPISGPTGRWEARGSPRNATSPVTSGATGGTNRITVPALPTSTRAPWSILASRKRHPSGPASMPPHSACTAAAINSVSRACSGFAMRVGPSATAARMSARLVIDFEPGSRSSARTGPSAAGAGQGSAAGGRSVAWCMVRAYWPRRRPDKKSLVARGWPERGDRVNNQIPGRCADSGSAHRIRAYRRPGSGGQGMCGRFASARKRMELLEEFGVQRDRVHSDLEPDYNVAPTKPVYAVLTRRSGHGDDAAPPGDPAAASSAASPAMPRRPRTPPPSASSASCAGAWSLTGPRTRRSAAG